jgi:transcriptional regulator of arginine metabolism
LGATKSRRHQAILRLLARERVGSQEEIRSHLASVGIEATQSTISRDVEDLGLVRVHDLDGARYVRAGSLQVVPAPSAPLRRLLEEFAVSFVRSHAGLLIRTPPGAAGALAEGIDVTDLREVAGTIAGDNTILVLGRENVGPRRLERLFAQIMEA